MFQKTFAFIEKCCLMLSYIAILALMVLTSFDVLARKIFDYSVPGLFELSSDYIMVALAFLPISFVYIKGGHVRIEMFLRFLPKAIMPALNKVLTLFAIVVYALMTIVISEKTISCFQLNQRASNLLAYPLWPSYFMIALGAGLLTIRLIQDLISPQSIKKLGEDAEEIINY